MSKDYRTISQILEQGLTEAKYTNVHNKIKNIKNLSRKEANMIANIDPAVLGKVIQNLLPSFKQMRLVNSVEEDVELEEGKLADEMIRRHFANVWAMSAKEPKILDMFHKSVNTANFNVKKKAYGKMPIGPFIRDELGGGYLDPKIIKKLNLKSS